ncbi:ACP:hemolysin acyltransferase (hemolysin-activating protein) [Caulobacter sp. AP07]|uniref:toxin-activating lysine-acyltransferase n=1 Tax=Caulobacter sp. AP07 TaxID=1144304 RepID=UPI0002721FB8|nr:toxin-activating lysine-acyltransferase [Caulobacter sp. AP07]EJL37920.1 ACP:hemolysin acyltransferase (hemolysin-activating protein) [Caulobacter sp. AP07]
MMSVSPDTKTADGAPGNGGGPRTVAEAIGQIVWLLSQSTVHRELKIKALEWSFMPAVVSEQFRIFRFGPTPGLSDADPASFAQFGLTREGLETLPLGVAIWANLSEAAEARLEAGEHLSAEDWTSGDRTWLVELISPFATPENRLSQIMLLDLVNGPFKGKTFHLHRTDPGTGKREKVTLGDA